MKNTKNLLKQIQQCKDCPLCNNQNPLLDKKIKADVMWVGLSAVKVECTIKEAPLSKSTNTGKLISEIENINNGIEFYKTNLVKCLPLKDEKIRYPKQEEMKSCFNHLKTEIVEFKPKLVFLLGKQVIDFIADKKDINFSDKFDYKPYLKDNITYVPVHHPSYILVYKRKNIHSYVDSINKIINTFI
ncbi:MAG: hypothetical protein KAX69_00485 [Chitinophagales bacterium]|nr:hypothetical protein [Chitinophagales bacterium]